MPARVFAGASSGSCFFVESHEKSGYNFRIG
jgi:hypothetical protein